MKNILYVVTKSVWGGAQRYVYDLATNLPKDRFEIAVAAGGSGSLFNKLDEAGVRTIPIKGLERDINPLKELQSFWNLFQIFRKEKPDVIHLNSSKVGGIGAVAGRIAGLFNGHRPRIVFTVHGWGFHENRNVIERFMIFAASWIAALFHDSVICIDQSDTASGAAFIPRRRLIYIPNGIKNKIPLSRPEARTELAKHIKRPLSPNTFIIGTIAELTKNKGLAYLFDAMQTANDPMQKLIIIGDGEDRTKLQEKIASSGLKNTVFLAGFIPEAERLVKGFDIFVLPSVKEGLPYTVMEAMSAGVPVIATTVGGIPDLITHEEHGLLVAPKNPDALAQAISRIRTDTAFRTRIVENGRQRIETLFPLRAMIEKTIAAYDESR